MFEQNFYRLNNRQKVIFKRISYMDICMHNKEHGYLLFFYRLESNIHYNCLIASSSSSRFR